MKIKDYLFTGTHKEEEIELSSESYLNLDHEYWEWSKRMDEQFDKEFGQYEGDNEREPF